MLSSNGSAQELTVYFISGLGKKTGQKDKRDLEFRLA